MNLKRTLRFALASLFLSTAALLPNASFAAAGTWTIYANAKLQAWGAGHNIDTDVYVMVLLGPGYTPIVNSDATYVDVSANEITGTGYSAGGQVITLSKALATGTVTVSMTSNTWPTCTCTAKYAAIVRRAGGSTVSGDKLLGYLDLNVGGGLTISSTAGNFTVTAGSGLFTQ